MKKKTEEEKVKNKYYKEEKFLKKKLIEYYSRQLTIFQNKIMLNQIKINLIEKGIKEIEENIEIEIYSKYKQVLNDISEKGIEFLMSACSQIESAKPDDKVFVLMNYCFILKIKA